MQAHICCCWRAATSKAAARALEQGQLAALQMGLAGKLLLPYATSGCCMRQSVCFPASLHIVSLAAASGDVAIHKSYDTHQTGTAGTPPGWSHCCSWTKRQNTARSNGRPPHLIGLAAAGSEVAVHAEPHEVLLIHVAAEGA